MSEKTPAPEQIADGELDEAQGGILTSNENVAPWDRETPTTKLHGNAASWGDATGHFD